MHDHSISAMTAVFAVANLVITAGYLAVPFLVLRYLPLTKMVLFWGAVFFIGCAGTHLGMAALVHAEVGLFWTAEHVIQAIGTWGFILTFHSMLRAASRRRTPEGANWPDAGLSARGGGEP
jgi:predicted tellurium resistance membrane protein TerC